MYIIIWCARVLVASLVASGGALPDVDDALAVAQQQLELRVNDLKAATSTSEYVGNASSEPPSERLWDSAERDFEREILLCNKGTLDGMTCLSSPGLASGLETQCGATLPVTSSIQYGDDDPLYTSKLSSAIACSVSPLRGLLSSSMSPLGDSVAWEQMRLNVGLT